MTTLALALGDAGGDMDASRSLSCSGFGDVERPRLDMVVLMQDAL